MGLEANWTLYFWSRGNLDFVFWGLETNLGLRLPRGWAMGPFGPMGGSLCNLSSFLMVLLFEMLYTKHMGKNLPAGPFRKTQKNIHNGPTQVGQRPLGQQIHRLCIFCMFSTKPPEAGLENHKHMLLFFTFCWPPKTQELAPSKNASTFFQTKCFSLDKYTK